MEQLVARWAHNPKVVGSSPTPATKEDSSSDLMGSFLFIPSEVLLYCDFARNKEFTFEVRYVLLVFIVSKSLFWSTLVQYSNQRDNLGVSHQSVRTVSLQNLLNFLPAKLRCYLQSF